MGAFCSFTIDTVNLPRDGVCAAINNTEQRPRDNNNSFFIESFVSAKILEKTNEFVENNYELDMLKCGMELRNVNGVGFLHGSVRSLEFTVCSYQCQLPTENCQLIKPSLSPYNPHILFSAQLLRVA